MAQSTQYDARMDSKKRIRLRLAEATTYHVEHRKNGVIVLKPSEVVSRTEDREKRLARIEAKAGAKVPSGIRLIDTKREPSAVEKQFAETLGAFGRQSLSKARKARA